MKLKRIDKYGCRGQIPVDMSEDFYNNGNEYCRYLITDYRASLLRKNNVLSNPTEGHELSGIWKLSYSW